MIWPRDAAVLAYTKLRTRRTRHAVVIVTSSLLFIIIACVLFVVRGTVSSFEGYLEEGFASRFVLSAKRIEEDLSLNKEVIARSKELQKDLIKQKTAEAKKLGIDYDQSLEPQVVNLYSSGNSSIESLNIQDYAPVNQAIREYYSKKQQDDSQKLLELGANYGIKKDVYYRKDVTDSGGYYLNILKDGKESPIEQGKVVTLNDAYIDNFSNSFALISAEVLRPFLLPNQNLEIGEDGSVPILVPYPAAIKLTNSKDLDTNANTKQKAEYLKDIRSKLAGINFEVCYRNKTSKGLLDSAISEIGSYNANKDKKDYVKPDLVRDLPKEKCGPVTTFRDTRNTDQKAYDAKVLSFEQKFNQEPPDQKIIKFRAVGMIPTNNNTTFSVQALIENILASSISDGWVSPIEATEKNDTLKKLTSSLNSDLKKAFFIEFSDATQAKKFLKEKNCEPDYSQANESNGYDSFAGCRSDGRNYSFSLFGGNALAIDQFKSLFYRYFNYAILYMGAFAALTLFGVISRVIADSRREVAVFRAIGAKRLDIAQIYITYSLMIGTIILFISLMSGVIVGQLLQSRYGSDLAITSSILFNTTTVDYNFKLYTISLQDIIKIILAVYLTCIASATFPIIVNARRNPISDMRDER